MNTDHTIEKQRNYLSNRLNNIAYRQDVKLRHQFNLIDDDEPYTVTELVERIQAGKYTVARPDGDGTKRSWHSNIRWRDPNVKADQDGFTNAWDSFRKTQQTVEDAIVIKDPKDALAELIAFETSIVN